MKKVSVFLAGLALFAASCSPAATPAPMMATSSPTTAMMAAATSMGNNGMASGASTPSAMMAEPTTTGGAMMGQATPSGGGMMSTVAPAGSMMEANWVGVELQEVSTGKTFKFSDFKGKVVYIELMAAWCTTCLQEQKNLQTILTPSSSDLVVVSLDIDPNENDSDLSNYVKRNQFPWSFAVAPKDAAHEIGQLYGDSFLNPPSAPVLVIDRKGEVHSLPLGLKGADDLKKDLAAYLAG